MAISDRLVRAAGPCFFLLLAGVIAAEPVRTPTTGAFRPTYGGTLADLALPDHYRKHLEDRATIDAHQIAEHAVAPGVLPSARPRFVAPPRVESGVRIVRADLSAGVVEFRQAHSDPTLPPRGFRAPILEHRTNLWAPTLNSNALAAADLAAARIVEQHLAPDGLIATLDQLLRHYGPTTALGDPPAFAERLMAVGYPTDLLQHFRMPGAPRDASSRYDRPLAVIVHLAGLLTHPASGPSNSAASSKKLPGKMPDPSSSFAFDFQPADVGVPGRRFEIATECGEHEIGFVRMQVGGGWRDGVLPGGSIDVIGQMVDQFRSADFLLSVFEGDSASFQAIITNSWRLRRRAQVTLCEEVVTPSAWAQDNGKAGRLVKDDGLDAKRATIVPRFACTDEGKSVFVPGESYQADGWQAAGLAVVHSSLLFEGGNLLAVREPRTGRRLLFIAETELYRNLALGLSHPQVLAALRQELGVDEVKVLPGVSYHLDFDVSFRTDGRDLIAFVNDAPAAARAVVALGLAGLLRQGLLAEDDAARWRAGLAAGRDQEVARAMRELVQRQRKDAGVLPASLSSAFVSDPTDEAAGNLQVFLLAVDLLACVPTPSIPPAVTSHSTEEEPAARAAYLAALRRMDDARRAQITALRELGCRVVAVPSMPDLYRSINYLNGLQHRGGFVMPGFGGFYASLDQSAAAIFRANLGADRRVAILRSSESQRLHGAIHCTVSVCP